MILGVRNASLAHRAVAADPSVGDQLPSDVVLREDGPETIVGALVTTVEKTGRPAVTSR